MNNQVFLSRFTPSLMTPDVLERIFVQRGDLAEHLVGIVRESVLTPGKHHTLVLGPRGIGKTHLLSLVHHRIAKQDDLRDRMRIAWLREEEWGVSSFLDLLHRILRTLAETYKDEALHAQTEKLFGLNARTAERRAGELLRAFLEGRTLVLMTENLDDMFSGLGKKEQHRFRAYLQEEESWTIVGTAQGLFAGVSLHESPFYGFFEVHHLQELSVDEAARLVMNIAKLSNDEELAAFVQSAEGRSRIRAIHHLAGGNHRVYVILSEFLTRETLDELVDPFLKAMDDLTPYYQARMAQLSPQQRKIIDFLCDTRGAVPVKQIAQRCFMTPQTASSQLKDLRQKGYVRSTPIGRDSYYELSEPLMRIALEVKKQRERPVRLFLDFLRYWYSRDELTERIAHIQPHAVLEQDYLKRVLESIASHSDDSLVAKYRRKYVTQATAGDFNGALETSERLVELRSDELHWNCLGWCHYWLGRPEEAMNAADRALLAESADCYAWSLRSTALAVMNRLQDALEAIDCAVRYSQNDEDKARNYGLRGDILGMFERDEEALSSYDECIRLIPASYLAWRSRAEVLLKLGRYQEAVASFEPLIEAQSMEAMDWRVYVQALEKLNRKDNALDLFDRVLAKDPTSAFAWSGRGRVLRAMARHEDAIVAFSRATTLAPGDAGVWMELGDTYNKSAQYDQALDAYGAAYERDPDDINSRLALVYQLLMFGRYDEALHLTESLDLSQPDQHLLATAKIGACCGLNRMEDARVLLDTLLRGGSAATADRRVIAALLTEVSRNSGGELAHRGWISLLVDSYVEHGAASHLAAGVVTAIPGFIPPEVSQQSANEWLALWREVAGPYPEFEMPLRLLQAAGEYRESGDERVLLALPAEERQILDEVLKSAELPQGMQKESRITSRATKTGRRRKR